MTGAITWHGRRGAVLLGPTENRVARWLLGMTKAGRVTIRTVDLAAATHVERSEAYRITARLRVLGLFGIENDRGGNHGGRRYWRTGLETAAHELDARKHREAWARIVAWAKARRDRIQDRLDAIRLTRDGRRAPAVPSHGPGSGVDALHGRQPDPGTFLERLVAAGLKAALASEFGGGVQ